MSPNIYHFMNWCHDLHHLELDSQENNGDFGKVFFEIKYAIKFLTHPHPNPP